MRLANEGKPAGALCAVCGIPLDSKHFDESGVVAVPEPGRTVVLACFELPPQYCGLLEYFAQYTDLNAANPAEIETPELEWVLLSNNHPIYPYTGMRRILNPWGFGSFELAIRLEDSAKLEFAVRHLAGAPSNGGAQVTKVGGRITGRYWYNPAYGDVVRNRY